MASAIYPAHRRAASVRVRLLDNDTAVVSTGISDFGTGGATMVTISVADALGIPLTRVTSEIGIDVGVVYLSLWRPSRAGRDRRVRSRFTGLAAVARKP